MYFQTFSITPMKNMMIAAFVAVMLFGSFDVSAQGLTPAAQTPTVIKPKMKVNDIRASIQFLGGIEIRGTEVDAYLDTRKVLADAVEAATKAGKKDDDAVTFDMKIEQAQNMFTLMQRGSLKGAEADKFKEIISALQDAVKAAQGK
jgi:ABC-type glycerol-3-phosphate transport system substrate-binding protein